MKEQIREKPIIRFDMIDDIDTLGMLNESINIIKSYDDTTRKAIEYYLFKKIQNIDLDMDFIESPIERLFWITYKENEYKTLFELNNHLKTMPIVYFQKQINYGEGDNNYYKVDFVIFSEINPKIKFAIELDGHEFHEKTKEQVKKDKERERNLQKLGWHVIRFSGSEVYNNPYKCWIEVIDIVKSKTI